MDQSREAPWAEHEKTYMLAEILKRSMSSAALFAIIRDNNILPSWSDIALPPGRSLRSCETAFNELLHASRADPRPVPPRQQPTPLLNPVQELPRKRALHSDLAPSGARPLQPRPPLTYSTDPYGSPYTSSPMGEPAQKKKRGRPTKAEAQQRAYEAAQRGEVYPPPNRKKPARPSITSSDGGGTPGAGPVSTAPIEKTSTPPHSQMEVEEISSGKRRRARPSRLEFPERQPEHSMQPPESPLQPNSSRQDTGRPFYLHSALSEEPSSATERRDVRMEGTEEYPTPRTQTLTHYPTQQFGHHQQAPPAPPPLPPTQTPTTAPPPPPPTQTQPQTSQTRTPRSFKETVGM